MAEGVEPLSVALDKLEEQLTCKICSKQFNDPRTLPCLHSFCLECVQKIFVHLKGASERLIKCPVCHRLSVPMDTLAESLPQAHYLNRLIEVKQDYFLPLSYEFTTSLCQRHREETKLYCLTCSVGVCLECTVRDHAHHSLRRLTMSEYYLPEDGEDEDGWIRVNNPPAPHATASHHPSPQSSVTPSPNSTLVRNIRSVPNFKQYTYGSGTPASKRLESSSSEDDTVYQVILNEYDLVKS